MGFRVWGLGCLCLCLSVCVRVCVCVCVCARRRGRFAGEGLDAFEGIFRERYGGLVLGFRVSG